jgi:hypothetical protein
VIWLWLYPAIALLGLALVWLALNSNWGIR